MEEHHARTPWYLIPDRQGTDVLAISSAAQAVTRRSYLPFGGTRGTAPATWPGDKGYAGGTLDSATSLENLGAREYDPATGRFTSPDPVFEAASPQQANGYDYAANNPVTDEDPAGLTECDAGFCPTPQQTAQVTREAAQDNTDTPVEHTYGTGISTKTLAPDSGTYERALGDAMAGFEQHFGYQPDDLNACQASSGGGFPACGGKDILDVLHFLHDFMCQEQGITCVGPAAGQDPLTAALSMAAASGMMFPGGGAGAGEEEAAADA
jgi:RHS repeat-associated protein